MSLPSYKMKVLILLFISITFFLLEWEFQCHILNQKNFTFVLTNNNNDRSSYGNHTKKVNDKRFIVSVLPIFQKSENRYIFPPSSVNIRYFCIIHWLLLVGQVSKNADGIGHHHSTSYHSIGGWMDVKTNRYYVDANLHFSSFQCATYVAKKYKQLAIYDATSCRSIRCL